MTNNNVFAKTTNIFQDLEKTSGVKIKTSDDSALCNYLNVLYSDLDIEKKQLLWAVCSTDIVYKHTIHELMDIILQLDEIYLLEHIRTAKELGEHYIYEMGAYDVPKNIQNYFDYKSFGQDVIDEGIEGYMTKYGYVQTFNYSEGSMFDENSVVLKNIK